MSDYPLKYITAPIDGLVSETREPIKRFWTGLIAADGREIFDEDIVAVKEDGEVIIDRVHWEDGAWRLGNYDGCLSDFQLLRVEGNTFEQPWPLNQ